MNKDDMQRNVDAVKRLQQFIETISATFRLMAADLDRLLQDLAQPLHDIARVEQEQQEALWRDQPRLSFRRAHHVRLPKKSKKKRGKVTGKR